MALTPDIVATYRAPGAVVRRRAGGRAREDRALMVLMVACLLHFVAQWPRLSREAALDPSIGFDARAGGALMGWLFVAPILIYGLAALGHLAARALGGQGRWYDARVAMFWALLAAAPLALLQGLTVGIVGPGIAANLVGLVSITAFLLFWALGLRAVEKGAADGD